MSEDGTRMTSHRPYLLRALWEWIADNGMTPHLLVDARQPGVRVPAHTVKDGKVVLNIADRAVAKLEMGNDMVSFSARFAGVSQSVQVPVTAILAIYARETGQGMALPEEMGASQTASAPEGGDPEASEPGDNGPDDDTPQPPKRGAHLRIVK
ncbi:MAG TPA: ClpXP protease specificity-enhancing factor [Xanthomonadaceae bacterium]|jgi:stringent starvation protein B|nr:ClpXP protease specificity-enhancing factor [Xanthomonadaceae bacterium]